MAGVEVQRFNEVAQDLISEHQVRRFAFSKKLIESLKTSHHSIAISGSPDILVRPFLGDLEIDEIYGSSYQHEYGKFTGIASSVGSKALILDRLAIDGVVDCSGSVAIGDTMSDVPMLEAADHPIMFNPSKTLQNYGKEFGWPIVLEVKDNITAIRHDVATGQYAAVEPEVLLRSLREVS